MGKQFYNLPGSRMSLGSKLEKQIERNARTNSQKHALLKTLFWVYKNTSEATIKSRVKHDLKNLGFDADAELHI